MWLHQLKTYRISIIYTAAPDLPYLSVKNIYQGPILPTFFNLI